jgi:predicted ATP-binding protein involved in virulence
MATGFKQLTLRDWRQFRKVDIKFHPELTVITGANGAGKTSILNILGKHFGWDVNFIATSKLRKKGAYKYYSGLHEEDDQESLEANVASREVGQLTYDDQQVAKIMVPRQVGSSFNVSLSPQQSIQGVFLPSHRAVYSYHQIDQIPTQLDAREQLFENYYSNIRSMYNSRRFESPSGRLKGALISLATFGYGNKVVQKDQGAIDTFEGFEKVLTNVLPPGLGFRRLSIRMPDVVFECSSGDFSLDAASGGIAAIVDVSWQIFLKSLLVDKFVVVCDEPENHLHPELQRSLLPGLLKAFPRVQFVVATHNPFVVTSVKESAVIVLDYVEDRVESKNLEEFDRSGSSDKVLTDVLGVPAPVPVWVEKRIEEIVKRYSSRSLNDQNLRNLRIEMSEFGLGHLFPEAISRVVEGKKSDKAR